MNHITIQNVDYNVNPKSECNSHVTSQATLLHACQPNIIQIYMYCNTLLYTTIQSHLLKNDHVKQINFSLIVQIKPIPFM